MVSLPCLGRCMLHLQNLAPSAACILRIQPQICSCICRCTLIWQISWPTPCRYEGYGGLSLYWVLLGSSGHQTRPDLPVTMSYLK